MDLFLILSKHIHIHLFVTQIMKIVTKIIK